MCLRLRGPPGRRPARRAGVIHEFDGGELASTTYLGRHTVRYETSDKGGLLVTDTTGAQHRFFTSAKGLVRKVLANNTEELALFDDFGSCRRKAVTWPGSSRAPWLRVRLYPRGQPPRQLGLRHGLTSHDYDDAHRIQRETLPGGESRAYRFDRANNLVEQPGLRDVKLNFGNRLQEANGEHFTYDDRLRLASRKGPAGTTHYRYNELHLLVSCEVNGETWTAGYDGFSRRTHKTWQGKTTTYYWDGFRLAAEVRQGSTRVYVYADEAALVPFLFVDYPIQGKDAATGKRYYVFTNQVGVPILVEDDDNRVCWSARVDPYGLVHLNDPPDVELRLRFPGHYHDPETGLHYNRFRYYSPELGRYLQQDPAGQVAATNLYAYPFDPLLDVNIDGLAAGFSSTKRRKRQARKRRRKAGCPDPAPGGAAPAPAGPPLRPEDKYHGSKKHGVGWTQGSQHAQNTGKRRASGLRTTWHSQVKWPELLVHAKGVVSHSLQEAPAWYTCPTARQSRRHTSGYGTTARGSSTVTRTMILTSSNRGVSLGGLHMQFAIQTSNPRPTRMVSGSDASVGEAIETIFPLLTEFAVLVWNNVYVPLNYKYDISVIFDDIVLLVHSLVEGEHGEFSIEWPSNTFHAKWRLSWTAEEVTVKGSWKSVIGGTEALLNAAPVITVGKEAFLAEWGNLLRFVRDLIRKCSEGVRLAFDLSALDRLLQRIPLTGQLYAN